MQCVYSFRLLYQLNDLLKAEVGVCRKLSWCLAGWLGQTLLTLDYRQKVTNGELGMFNPTNLLLCRRVVVHGMYLDKHKVISHCSLFFLV